jgi:AraC-like DNA-binding protein
MNFEPIFKPEAGVAGDGGGRSATFRFIGRVRKSRPWHLGPQEHPFYEMIVVVRGQQGVRIGGNTLRAGPGEVLLYPAGNAHEEWRATEAPLETLFVAFDWPAAPAEIPLRFGDDRGRLRVMAEWLHAERETRARSSTTVSGAILQCMLAECRALWERRDPDIVTALRLYVEQHIELSFALADLARAMGMSRHHLVRTYRALTGHTPMADVTRLRLERARDLILTTAIPLKEIAPRVGLTDVYRLCRLFRRHLDTTPGSLRKRNTPK